MSDKWGRVGKISRQISLRFASGRELIVIAQTSSCSDCKYITVFKKMCNKRVFVWKHIYYYYYVDLLSEQARPVTVSWLIKAAFHYSSQLHTWFRPSMQPRFRQARPGLRHAFDQLSTFFCRKPCREPQQVRWFVRVLDKWNVRRKKPILSKFAAGFRPASDLQIFNQVCSWLE